jgi:hypothetical protein
MASGKEFDIALEVDCIGKTSVDGSIDDAIALSTLMSGSGLVAVAALRLNPQCPQNLASDNTVAPQLGH